MKRDKTKRTPFLIILFIFIGLQNLYSQSPPVDLWQNGAGNYNHYRIPSLLVTKMGTLLAFCEGREGGDAGDIDLLVKRSSDNGRSWSDEAIVWNDDANICGNPCQVV